MTFHQTMKTGMHERDHSRMIGQRVSSDWTCLLILVHNGLVQLAQALCSLSVAGNLMIVALPAAPRRAFDHRYTRAF